MRKNGAGSQWRLTFPQIALLWLDIPDGQNLITLNIHIIYLASFAINEGHEDPGRAWSHKIG